MELKVAKRKAQLESRRESGNKLEFLRMGTNFTNDSHDIFKDSERRIRKKSSKARIIKTVNRESLKHKRQSKKNLLDNESNGMEPLMNGKTKSQHKNNLKQSLPFKSIKKKKNEKRVSNLESYQKLKVQRTKEYSLHKKLHDHYLKDKSKKGETQLENFSKMELDNTNKVKQNLDDQKKNFRERLKSRKDKSVSRIKKKSHNLKKKMNESSMEHLKINKIVSKSDIDVSKDQILNLTEIMRDRSMQESLVKEKETQKKLSGIQKKESETLNDIDELLAEIKNKVKQEEIQMDVNLPVEVKEEKSQVNLGHHQESSGQTKIEEKLIERESNIVDQKPIHLQNLNGQKQTKIYSGQILESEIIENLEEEKIVCSSKSMSLQKESSKKTDLNLTKEIVEIKSHKIDNVKNVNVSLQNELTSIILVEDKKEDTKLLQQNKNNSEEIHTKRVDTDNDNQNFQEEIRRSSFIPDNEDIMLTKVVDETNKNTDSNNLDLKISNKINPILENKISEKDFSAFEHKTMPIKKSKKEIKKKYLSKKMIPRMRVGRGKSSNRNVDLKGRKSHHKKTRTGIPREVVRHQKKQSVPPRGRKMKQGNIKTKNLSYIDKLMLQRKKTDMTRKHKTGERLKLSMVTKSKNSPKFSNDQYNKNKMVKSCIGVGNNGGFEKPKSGMIGGMTKKKIRSHKKKTKSKKAISGLEKYMKGPKSIISKFKPTEN